MSNLTHHIAAQLKYWRGLKGWSLDQTAQATGISKAMLGQIERAESNPTVVTLWKIAMGFQTSLSSFLPDDQHNLTPLQHHEEALSVKVLQPYDKKLGYEILHVRLKPASKHLSCAHDQGVVEDILTLNASLQMQIGELIYTAKPGENLRFNADQPHQYINPHPFEVEFYNIVHYRSAV